MFLFTAVADIFVLYESEYFISYVMEIPRNKHLLLKGVHKKNTRLQNALDNVSRDK
jgi:hypothetical protein